MGNDCVLAFWDDGTGAEPRTHDFRLSTLRLLSRACSARRDITTGMPFISSRTPPRADRHRATTYRRRVGVARGFSASARRSSHVGKASHSKCDVQHARPRTSSLARREIRTPIDGDGARRRLPGCTCSNVTAPGGRPPAAMVTPYQRRTRSDQQGYRVRQRAKDWAVATIDDVINGVAR